jgi:5-formyltetrahydrofolate cyclo-ligase
MGLASQALKTRMREEMRASLAGLSVEHRENASKEAVARLTLQKIWQEANFVMFYAPFKGEIDLWPILARGLEAGKTMALPRFDADAEKYVPCSIMGHTDDLVLGRYGIREPNQRSSRVPLNRLDFVLVPGVAFDLRGHRLGRGKGFYDRMLAVVRGKTCGVAFDEQIVREVPVEPHDSDVNCILTPTRWIEL